MSRERGKLRVLVVEDEEAIREGLCDVLIYHGYLPTAVGDGEQGLERGLADPFDLVILDIMLPGLSGLDVCRQLRAARPRLPILMLTAKGSEDDVVKGFRAGADDYVTKPFSVREWVVRVEALLRRAGKLDADESFDFGSWQIDARGLMASIGNDQVPLTRREVEILALLARERGRVVSRRSLLKEVWDMANVDAIETRTVDVHIAKLRKKMDRDGLPLIATVRGAGYRFTGS